mmetsp:Transcript_10784/g.35742  ORF Transcript_10784/g.35742 Transcript_10784/m.35742 type:complete len:313 (+) Transcript_10784:437-1375(+)
MLRGGAPCRHGRRLRQGGGLRGPGNHRRAPGRSPTKGRRRRRYRPVRVAGRGVRGAVGDEGVVLDVGVLPHGALLPSLQGRRDVIAPRQAPAYADGRRRRGVVGASLFHAHLRRRALRHSEGVLRALLRGPRPLRRVRRRRVASRPRARGRRRHRFARLHGLPGVLGKTLRGEAPRHRQRHGREDQLDLGGSPQRPCPQDLGLGVSLLRRRRRQATSGNRRSKTDPDPPRRVLRLLLLHHTPRGPRDLLHLRRPLVGSFWPRTLGDVVGRQSQSKPLRRDGGHGDRSPGGRQGIRLHRRQAAHGQPRSRRGL